MIDLLHAADRTIPSAGTQCQRRRVGVRSFLTKRIGMRTNRNAETSDAWRAEVDAPDMTEIDASPQFS
jgi:hypothetical protein